MADEKTNKPNNSGGSRSFGDERIDTVAGVLRERACTVEAAMPLSNMEIFARAMGMLLAVCEEGEAEKLFQTLKGIGEKQFSGENEALILPLLVSAYFEVYRERERDFLIRGIEEIVRGQGVN